MKLLRTTALTAALMTAAVPSLTSSAHAAWNWRGGWGWGGLGLGLAAGALIGGAIAASSYGYGYGYPYYGYGYGYPAYGYGYGYARLMPLTAMATPAITAITEPPITPLFDAVSMQPLSDVTGATKEPSRR